MKIVALEEHFVTSAVRDAWDQLPADRAEPSHVRSSTGLLAARLEDLAERRLSDMDDSGVDIQVLSLTTPGVQSLDPDVAVALARTVNDAIAAVASRPARELRRAVDTLPVIESQIRATWANRESDRTFMGILRQQSS